MKKDTQALQESIRAQAYLLSEQAGHPPGKDKYFWFQAEAMILGQAGSSNGATVSKGETRKNIARKRDGRATVPAQTVRSAKTASRKEMAAR